MDWGQGFQGVVTYILLIEPFTTGIKNRDQLQTLLHTGNMYVTTPCFCTDLGTRLS